MLTRGELEAIERKTLAPYAIASSASRGRDRREAEHPYRTCFQRDHDRIIHCTAFRRLEYKTQVFVIHEGDYYRTRLTHTLEVAQIARTVGRTLGLNTDLIEAIALAHDLGHGPFGHSGGDALAEIMKLRGGFDHNLQALRIVDRLENRYPGFLGLNLTWEVRQGLNKHRAALEDGKAPAPQLGLEAQVVNIADEIAYDHHDLDDGITSGLLKVEALGSVPLWRQAQQEVRGLFPKASARQRKDAVIRRLINDQVTDLLRESTRRIGRSRIRRPADAERLPGPVIAFSSSMSRSRSPLKAFLQEKLYRHHKVVRMADKARRVVTALFEVYLKNPDQLPFTATQRLKAEPPHRVICDYIAGMTDRFAMDEYRKLFV